MENIGRMENGILHTALSGVPSHIEEIPDFSGLHYFVGRCAESIGVIKHDYMFSFIPRI
jgi:hypothetical protein